MTTIRRRNPDATEEVEVPDGYKVCGRCEGRGSLTKYEQGYTSVVYHPRFDAPERCFICGGQGFVRDE